MVAFKKLSVLLFACGISVFSFGQVTVRVQVRDSVTRMPLSYSSVYLAGKKNKGGITDSLGRVILKEVPEGNYTLRASYSGFEASERVFLLKKDTTFLLLLKPLENLLGEIVVKGGDAILENKPDRSVMTIGPANKGQRISKALAGFPFITVAGNNVLINGKANYKIHRDGMPSNLTINDLNTLPVNQVEKIEVIYYPSIRYESDAEQIINIVSKKDEIFQGGDVWSRLGWRSGAGLNNSGTGTNLSKLNGKVNSNLSLLLFRDHTRSGNHTDYRVGENTSEMESESLTANDLLRLTLSEDFKLKNKQTLSLGASGSLGINNSDTRFIPADNPETLVNTESSRYELNVNGNYYKALKKTDKMFFSNLLKYAVTPEKYTLNREGDLTLNRNDTRSTQLVSRLDFELPRGKGTTWELGGGLTYRKYFQEIMLSEVNGPDNSYHQKVINGYGSLTKQLGKWYTITGLKLEGTQNKISGDTTLNRINVIPRVFVSRPLSEKNSLSLSYTRKIWRPGPALVSIFRDNSNPLFVNTGNRHLGIGLTDMLSLRDSWSLGKTYLSINYNLAHSKDAMGTRRAAGEDNRIVTSFVNISNILSHELAYSLNTSFGNKKLVFFSNGGIQRIRYSYTGDKNRGWERRINLGFESTQVSHFTFSGFYSLVGNTVTLQGETGNSHYMNFEALYKAGKKSQITLRSQNPVMNAIKTRRSLSGPSFAIREESYYRGRTVELSYVYSFGKVKKVRKSTRDIQVDDLREAE